MRESDISHICALSAHDVLSAYPTGGFIAICFSCIATNTHAFKCCDIFVISRLTCPNNTTPETGCVFGEINECFDKLCKMDNNRDVPSLIKPGLIPGLHFFFFIPFVKCHHCYLINIQAWVTIPGFHLSTHPTNLKLNNYWLPLLSYQCCFKCTYIALCLLVSSST